MNEQEKAYLNCINNDNNMALNDPRANVLSAFYNPKYDPRSPNYDSGVHNPLSYNYDPYHRF